MHTKEKPRKDKCIYKIKGKWMMKKNVEWVGDIRNGGEAHPKGIKKHYLEKKNYEDHHQRHARMLKER